MSLWLYLPPVPWGRVPPAEDILCLHIEEPAHRLRAYEVSGLLGPSGRTSAPWRLAVLACSSIVGQPYIARPLRSTHKIIFSTGQLRIDQPLTNRGGGVYYISYCVYMTFYKYCALKAGQTRHIDAGKCVCLAEAFCWVFRASRDTKANGLGSYDR